MVAQDIVTQETGKGGGVWDTSILEVIVGVTTYKNAAKVRVENELQKLNRATPNTMVLPQTLFSSSLATSVLATGRAIVTNQCDQPIYLWSVGSTISNQTTLPKDSSYSELFTSDPEIGGISIKISSAPDGIFNPDLSQLIFAYTIDEALVWYNLSTVNGNGLSGRTIRVQPSDETCDPISWYDGRAPAEGQVKHCQKEINLELTLCTGHCLPSWCK